ncbi:MAG: FAD-linked oxidase C-terminal domain-containing protein [Burkholderia gladioli]
MADAATRAQRQREVVQALMAVLPSHCLLYRDEDTAAYECDGRAAYRRLPLAVALPETESQVQRIVQICRRLNVPIVPIVPRGAGTSLSGGALPNQSGTVVSLARFTRIVEVDSYARTATVQPGVRNIAISEAAAPYGLYYAPDPSSQIACTIGCNVAENSGGVHCLKYSLTVHNVLRVRAVTIDGDVVEFGSLALDTSGLDLLAVMIGSEGMFAIVTEITVKLIPRPQTAQLVMTSFDDVVKGGEAVAAIIAAGIVPAGLEMMDKPATRTVEAFTAGRLRPGRGPPILLCESDGTPDEVAEEIARVTSVLRTSGATRIQVSRSEAERLRFWSGRKNAFPAAGRISPDYYCMDGTVPRRAIGPLLARIEQMEAQYGLRCINVFHAGDGNMHPILFNANDPDELHRAELFGADILESCVKLGGTVTGKHGVGVEKLNSMCVQFSPEERDAFFAVKRAFDPASLLNPDKGIPSRARCAEYGRMHVRGGLLPRPDLPRF